MEDKKTIQLLQYLAEHTHGFTAAKSIASQLDVSLRTVTRYIRIIEQQAAKGGFVLERKRGGGYRLHIADLPRFDAYCRGADAEDSGEILSDLIILLLMRKGVHLDDLAERYNYSRSTISRLIPRVEARLLPFNVNICSRGTSGLYPQAKEVSIRAAILAHLGSGDLSKTASFLGIAGFSHSAVYEKVADLATSGGLQVTPSHANRFIRFMLVSAARTANSRLVGDELQPDPSVLYPSAGVTPNWAEALDAIEWVRPALEEDGERRYLSLAWDQWFADAHPAIRTTEEVPVLFKEMVLSSFVRIQSRYSVDFGDDTALLDNLAAHIYRNYSRYLLGADPQNPYAEAVRSKYPLGYYYTLELAEEITRHTNMPVLPGMLGYLTLHMACALERSAKDEKIAVAILCSTAFGTAALLKTKLEKHCVNTLNIVGVYSVREAETTDLPVDLYISAVPTGLGLMRGKPLLELSSFLDQSDQMRLDAVIARHEKQVPICEFLSPEQFFYLERPAKKQSVLEALCNELIDRGRMTKRDMEAIMAREALVSTEICPQVAMPHCLIEGTSFLSFAVLGHPVFWGQGKVRLVLLGCFQKQDTRVKRLLPQLYRVLSNEKYVSALVACRDCGKFFTLLEAYLHGGNRSC